MKITGKILLILAALSFAGCTGSNSISQLSSGNSSSGNGSWAVGAQDNLVNVPNQFNLLSTYKTLTGTSPSSKTLAVFNGGNGMAPRGGLINPTGDPTTVNAAAFNIGLIAAAETCNDLVAQEAALPANSANRVFFKNIDFTQSNSNQLTSSVITTVAGAMAQQFWHRSLAADEQNMFTTTAATLTGLTGNNTMKPSQTLMALCAGALSSIGSTSR